MTVAEFFASGDKPAFLAALNSFEMCKFLAELRRHPFEHETARAAALEPAALNALQRFGDNEYVMAPALAALLDLGQVSLVLRHLAARCDELAANRFLMSVFARALGLRGRRNSRLVAFRLAESLKMRTLTPAESQWMRDRLNDPTAGIPDFFEPWPQGEQALERPDRFDGVLQVPNLPNFTVRMVSSKTQIERFANRLHNCLNSMAERILSDQTRVIGVERDGHPYEAIEVNPRGGLVRQWKGLRNREADSATQPIIERFLLTLGAIRSRQLGGSWW
jgi:hypothetical protein